MAEALEDAAKIAELRAIVEGIRDRVRSQYPEGSAPVDAEAPAPVYVPLADLMPLVRARDAAQAKMAAIGTVNPRAGGAVNNAIQFVKRSVARALGWFVRDQIVFNRGVMECVEASIEAMNEVNRSVTSLAGSVGKSLRDGRHAAEPRLREMDEAIGEAVSLSGETRRLLDLRTLESNKAADAWRATAAARHGEFMQATRAQHAEFENSLARVSGEAEARLDRALPQIKLEFERIIHNELRVIRQKNFSAAPVPSPSAPAGHDGVPVDYQAFSHRFRGSEEYVKANQGFYVDRFRGMGEVLDIGCGQGEFLEAMRDAGLPARGIDSSAEAIANCRAKGLQVEQADLFAHLAANPDHSLDAIFISQVVEHLPANRIPEMIALCSASLRSSGMLVLETPNPECLAIFATHFYLDPTHVRPVPSALLAFYMEENGMGGIEVKTRFPAVDSYPELAELPEGVRNRFFGGLDYAIFGTKL